MKEMEPGSRIYYGESFPRKKAIVCQIYDPNNIEVVYLDDRDHAINEDMILRNGKWEFKHEGPCGGYADNYPRLSNYVSMLRS